MLWLTKLRNGTTTRPIIHGPRLDWTGVLRMSITATTNMTRNAVPTIWSRNGPPQPPWKYGAGNVAKIE